MSGEKALARIGGFSKLVKKDQKGTVNYWRQEKSKPDWGYIQPQNMMEDTIPFNASDRSEPKNHLFSSFTVSAMLQLTK